MTPDPGIRGQPPEPWPRCPHCGGPARPVGEPPFRWRYALATRSEANARDRWGKVRRKVEAKSATFDEVAVALASGQSLPERGPWYVRLTRVAPKKLDRSDNLPRALKAVQDELAAVLGVDDGSDAVEWACAQASDGAFEGVVVEVWGAPPLPVAPPAK